MRITTRTGTDAGMASQTGVPASPGPATDLQEAYTRSAAEHDRLCPRQVLGVRIGHALADALRIPLPDIERRLLVLAEIDGCFVDGIQAVTGCSAGHRSLKFVDYGRVAATGIDTCTGLAFRAAPRGDVRLRAGEYAHGESRRYYAQLTGYQRMPDAELLHVTPVRLAFDLARLLGQKSVRVNCDGCSEEILNQREELVDGHLLCPACRGPRYYTGL